MSAPTDGAGPSSEPAPQRPTFSWGQVVKGGLGLVLAVILLVWGLPYFAKTSWDEIFEVLGTIPVWHAVGYQLLMLVGLYFYTFTFTASLPGLSHGKALIINLCGSSVSNLLPAGGALGLAATYAMCRSWGFTNRDTSTSAIVTGVWNVMARVLLPVIAIVMLWWGNTGLPPALTNAAITGALTGLAVVVVMSAALGSERAAQAIGRGLDRTLRPLLRRRIRTMSLDTLVTDLRHRIGHVVRRGWPGLTFGMVAFFGVYFLLFWLIMHGVGVVMPLGILFAAYAIGRLLTSVGVTPGGMGVTEVATSAALVGWGANPAAATSAVVLFSIFTHAMEVPLGALGWVLWSASPKVKAPSEST